MNKKYFVLTSVCAAALVVTACGGGDAAPVAATATPPTSQAPAPTGTAPAAATPTTSVTVTVPATTAPAPGAPVTTTPAGTAPAAATPTTSVTTPSTGAPTTTPTTPAAIVTNLTGSVVKGPVGNATVTAKKPDGTACGTTATNATGQYTFTTSCTGDVIIEVKGGSYLDEATNVNKALDTPLFAVVAANGGAVTGIVTPLTTMAYSYAFTSSNAASKAAFDAQAAKIAAQFGLTGVNLATTLPVVAGTTNAYGNTLKGISQYLKDNPTQTLAAVTTATLKTALSSSNFSKAFSTSYNTINGTAVTYSFDGAAFNITGTGAGGGSATCGVSLQGTVTTAGFAVPVSFDYCVTGLVGACDSGNQSLSQSLAAAGQLPAGVNITASFGPTCAAGAIPIVIK